MASSLFFRDSGHKEVGVVTLFLKADIGASGAPTLDTAASKGIASIVRDNTGLYTITLSDSYNSLLFADFQLVDDDLADITFQVTASAVSSATPTVELACKAAASAADPASGSDLLARIVLKNSSV